jgi:hypothetical protein
MQFLAMQRNNDYTYKIYVKLIIRPMNLDLQYYHCRSSLLKCFYRIIVGQRDTEIRASSRVRGRAERRRCSLQKLQRNTPQQKEPRLAALPLQRQQLTTLKLANDRPGKPRRPPKNTQVRPPAKSTPLSKTNTEMCCRLILCCPLTP